MLPGVAWAANQRQKLKLLPLRGYTPADVNVIRSKECEACSSLEVSAEPERAAGYPAVYTEIKLTYRVGGKVSPKSVEDAVRLSQEKYCSVSAMVEKTAKITTAIEYLEA